MNRISNCLSKLGFVQFTATCYLGQIDGAKITRFIRKQRLFATGIRSLNLTQLRDGIGLVDVVQENDSWFSALPGRPNNPVKDGPGRNSLDNFLVPWIDQVVVFISI